ncbi:hypothetical protein RINTHM_4890 [Richelia intracellularis HM01]|nr:hypothetical protein RINTHM_4890 [Richelia intracellularis HM01]
MNKDLISLQKIKVNLEIFGQEFISTPIETLSMGFIPCFIH